MPGLYLDSDDLTDFRANNVQAQGAADMEALQAQSMDAGARADMHSDMAVHDLDADARAAIHAATVPTRDDWSQAPPQTQVAGVDAASPPSAASQSAPPPPSPDAPATSGPSLADTAATPGLLSQAGTPAVRQSQFGLGLSSADAMAFCGPTAAIAFAQTYGRNPTAEEAKALAQQVGWNPNQGMAGVQSEQKLLSSLGIQTKLENGVDWNHVAQDAAGGNPVILDTPGHYYYISGVRQGANGVEFNVGTSGTDLRGGSTWMTAEQINAMPQSHGQVRAALYADHPLASGPSQAEGNPITDAIGKAGDAVKGAASIVTSAVQNVAGAVSNANIDPNLIAGVSRATGMPVPSGTTASGQQIYTSGLPTDLTPQQQGVLGRSMVTAAAQTAGPEEIVGRAVTAGAGSLAKSAELAQALAQGRQRAEGVNPFDILSDLRQIWSDDKIAESLRAQGIDDQQIQDLLSAKATPEAAPAAEAAASEAPAPAPTAASTEAPAPTSMDANNEMWAARFGRDPRDWLSSDDANPNSPFHAEWLARKDAEPWLIPSQEGVYTPPEGSGKPGAPLPKDSVQRYLLNSDIANSQVPFNPDEAPAPTAVGTGAPAPVDVAATTSKLRDIGAQIPDAPPVPGENSVFPVEGSPPKETPQSWGNVALSAINEGKRSIYALSNVHAANLTKGLITSEVGPQGAAEFAKTYAQAVTGIGDPSRLDTEETAQWMTQAARDGVNFTGADPNVGTALVNPLTQRAIGGAATGVASGAATYGLTDENDPNRIQKAVVAGALGGVLGATLAGRMHDALWQTAVPQAQTMVYRAAVENGMAGTEAATYVNRLFGTQNLEQMLGGRAQADLARAVLQAPGWLFGEVSNAAGAARGLLPGAPGAAQASRGWWLKTLLFYGVLTQAAQLAATGHLTDQNSSGSQFQLEIPTGKNAPSGKPANMTFGIFPGQAQQILDAADRIKDDPAAGAAETIQNRISRILMTGGEELFNQQYPGGPPIARPTEKVLGKVRLGDDDATALQKRLEFAAGQFAPISIAGGEREAAYGAPVPLIAASTLLGQPMSANTRPQRTSLVPQPSMNAPTPTRTPISPTPTLSRAEQVERARAALQQRRGTPTPLPR